jgi:hypothetical protein
VVRRPGNGVDRLGGGAGRRWHAEQTEKKDGEKAGEVGGQWLLFSGPVARTGRKKGAGGFGVRHRVEEKTGQRGGEGGRAGFGDVDWHGMDTVAPGCSNSGGRHTPCGRGAHGCDRGGRRRCERCRCGRLTGRAGRHRGPVTAARCRWEHERVGQHSAGR